MNVDALTTPWPTVDHVLNEQVLCDVARRAPSADRVGEPAADSIQQLKDVGWPGLAVPSQFGGGGATLVECCAAQRKLAQADPGLAIGLNMHLFSVGLMVEHWRRRTDTSWLLMEAIATQNRILASAFAEPNLGGSASRSTLTAIGVGGGWQVSGTKRPCSFAEEADLVCFQVQTDTGRTIVALLPTTAPGLSVRRDWNALGMRGSASNTLLLDKCIIPDDLVFYEADTGDESDDVLAAGVVWFTLTATACYLGLAQAAIGESAKLLRKLRVGHLDSARAELPSYQAAIGDSVAELLTIEAACAQVASWMEARAEPKDVLTSALAVKQQAIRGIPRLLDVLAEACGGVVYGASGEFARLWRDVQAIRFHPPTPVATRQHLARRALGFPNASLDLDESAPGLQDGAQVVGGVR